MSKQCNLTTFSFPKNLLSEYPKKVRLNQRKSRRKRPKRRLSSEKEPQVIIIPLCVSPDGSWRRVNFWIGPLLCTVCETVAPHIIQCNTMERKKTSYLVLPLFTFRPSDYPLSEDAGIESRSRIHRSLTRG